MRQLSDKLRKFSMKPSFPPGFYRNEAKCSVKKYNINDPNFKYFIREFITEVKNHIDLDTLRDIISDLQKNFSLRACRNEESDDYSILRDKTKRR